ncbi:MAG: hypothetical protein D6731_12280 [Planctomycetota bacterium]|nr:MAG: hypothetical protein D6731_12280 [Planctomycetota bacterium]
MRRLFVCLLLLVGAALAWAPAARADEVADLLRRLEASGARVLRVAPGDPRLDGGRVTARLAADGAVEVLLPEGGVRTPLVTPTRRMSVEEFRAFAADVRRAVREATGVEVERVLVAGSSSGIPFLDPSGTLRTFDRKGPGSSDYDGAVVSRELFDLVARERPRAVRGRTTGLRTAPDPLPRLHERLAELGRKYGRKVAVMVYPSEAEFQRRMEFTGLRVGRNVMPEPGAAARAVEVTRAELVGALVEVELLSRLARRGGDAARELLARARGGERAAAESLRALRLAALDAVAADPTALERVDRETLAFARERLAPPAGFAVPRGPRGPPPPLRLDGAALEALFESAREAVAARLTERAGELAPGEGRRAAEAAERVRDARLEVVEGSERLVEYRPETHTVRASTAALNAVLALPGAGSALSPARAKVLALLFAHELAHAGGVRSERVADAEAVRAVARTPALRGGAAGRATPFERADLRAAVDLFARGGSTLADALYALKGLGRYGSPRGREVAMARASAGLPDRFASYRRADGTIDWGRLSAEGARAHGAGLLHFGLALFLKELAVVARTGDRLRLEEFFGGLLTTDFFLTYGLFSAGAHAGNVAYSRFLARHVKPRFVSNVLRTNVTLALGMALPELVSGRFDGKAFAIDLGALALSATAVKAGLAGVSWVYDLGRAERAGHLLRAGARLRSLARAGAWLYSAAETAVVLYFGEALAERARAALDERAARREVAEAGRAALRAARGDDAEAFASALARLRAAHQDWRDLLLADLDAAEARYLGRLGRAARDAKLLADRERALRDRLAGPGAAALRARLLARHGDLDAAVEARFAADRAALERRLAEAMQAYERERAEVLRRVYEGPRREGAYLDGVALDASGFWARRRFAFALREVSANRLQAYEDELAFLDALRGVASPGALGALDRARAEVAELARRDAALLGDRSGRGGLNGVLRGAGR